MKQVFIYKGKAELRDVPCPVCGSGSILVNTAYSCISAGTESSSVRGSGESLFHKAITRPETAFRYAKMILSKGPQYVANSVKTKTSYGFGNPIGYTAAGVVAEVGNTVTGFKPGDRVAIVGGRYAYHAAVNVTPVNLAVKVPEQVSLQDAATSALGGIAMQGVHRLDPCAGDTVLVVGMGLIGQLTTQILLSYGCKVICSDINEDRLAIVQSRRNVKTISGAEDHFSEKVIMLNSGKEVDGAIFTAATSSSAPLSNCFKSLRRKGVCVLVGVSGMEIDRNDIYAKELDFRISTSYGPGRYDSYYEEGGKDYPIKYVPFTEKRNIEEYLQLIEKKKIDLSIVTREVYPAEKCEDAFNDALTGKGSMIGLLDYTSCTGNEDKVIIRKKDNTAKKGVIQVALIGAGSYAKNMHLPNLDSMPDKYHIRAIMNRSGAPAAALAEQYDVDYCTTDINAVLEDEKIDMVFICTRHDSHVDLAVKALKAGKHVLVEKPPALDERGLNLVLEEARKSGKIFTVGYNRRFSKYLQEIKSELAKRDGPVTLRYLMNAGFIPYDNWVHNEGGGRIIGEGCHIVDLIVYLLGTDIESISVRKITSKHEYYHSNDNVAATITFKDGSVALFEYISTGSTAYPKETMDIYRKDKHIVLKDYMRLEGCTKAPKDEEPNKGQREMLTSIYDSWKNGLKEVIPLNEIKITSEITFEIDKDEVRIDNE